LLQMAVSCTCSLTGRLRDMQAGQLADAQVDGRVAKSLALE
jgi:hypothetical protein